MTRILAIDPGTTHSAWLHLWDGVPQQGFFGIVPNAQLIDELLTSGRWDERPTVVIEQIESFGMAVGREVFETVRWAGRFEQAAWPLRVELIPRRTVKLALCGSSKAKDANIRQALIDRFGGPAATRKGGVLYGVAKDVWSALALAIAWADGVR